MAIPTRPEPSGGPLLFGDLLALARRSWIRQMANSLRQLGYEDYRPTDAAVFRRLLRGPIPVGRLDEVLGASRQAARKVVEGLERRGYASTERDPEDARRLIVSLTPVGQSYAEAVVNVVESLNGELVANLKPGDLAAARKVLLTVMAADVSDG